MLDRDKIRLLLNGDKARRVVGWLTEDIVYEFRFFAWHVVIWSVPWYVSIGKWSGFYFKDIRR